MTDEHVRGHWLSGAVAFMTVHFPAETGHRLLENLARDVRLAAPRVGLAEWCPRTHHVELLRAIASVSQDERGVFDDLVAYGQFVATEATRGPLKPLLSIVTPRMFAKRLPDLWAMDHRGESKLDSDFALLDEGRLVLRLSGIRGYDHVGVARLGWVKSTLGELIGKTPQLKQSGWGLRHSAPSEMTCEVTWS